REEIDAIIAALALAVRLPADVEDVAQLLVAGLHGEAPGPRELHRLARAQAVGSGRVSPVVLDVAESAAFGRAVADQDRALDLDGAPARVRALRREVAVVVFVPVPTLPRAPQL